MSLQTIRIVSFWGQKHLINTEMKTLRLKLIYKCKSCCFVSYFLHFQEVNYFINETIMKRFVSVVLLFLHKRVMITNNLLDKTIELKMQIENGNKPVTNFFCSLLWNLENFPLTTNLSHIQMNKYLSFFAPPELLLSLFPFNNFNI